MEFAKVLLCKQGPTEFAKQFGEYYVVGHNLGASILIDVKSYSKSYETENSLTDDIRAGWSGWGVSAESDNGFGRALKESNNFHKIETTVTMKGADKGNGV